MNTRHEGEEPERREGLGGRVRRFVDNELSRVLDKEEPEDDPGQADLRREPERSPSSTGAQEPVTPHADAPGPVSVSQPVTPAPVDPGYDTPGAAYGTAGYDAPGHGATAHDPSAETAGTARLPGRSADEVAAEGSAERMGLLDDPAGLREQWQRVQGTFVDDPQRAVQEAGALVERTLQEIHENVTRHRINDPTSTEDLRMSFQRYREFFQRLLSA